MKCPVCVEQGLRSRLYPGLSSTTCMGYTPYYDEDGDYVDNDPNIRTRRFSCSEGHRFVERTQHGKTEVLLPPKDPIRQAFESASAVVVSEDPPIVELPEGL